MRLKYRSVAWWTFLSGVAWGCGDPTGPVGDFVWRTEVARVRGVPAITDSLIVYPLSSGGVVALNLSDGAVEWTTPLGTGFADRKMVATNGVVVAPQYGLVGMAASTGTVLWRYGGPVGSAGTTAPTSAGDTVYSASLAGWVAAIDVSDGTPFWEVNLVDAVFDPVVGDNAVFYGTRKYLGGPGVGPLGSGHIVALDRASGSELWRLALPDVAGILGSGGALSGGVVAGEYLYVVSVPGDLYKINAATGDVIWKADNEYGPAGSLGHLPPAVIGDVVIVPRKSIGSASAFAQADGLLVWSESVEFAVDPFLVMDDAVFMAAGKIVAIDATGNTFWSIGGLHSAGIAYGSFSGKDGVIYVEGFGDRFNPGIWVFAFRVPGS